jgi:hypothetical protein
MKKNLLSAGGLLALAGVASCTDVSPVTPTMSPTSANRAVAATNNTEASEVSPILAALNGQLAASGAKVRIAKAELLMDGANWNGATSTIIFASDRARGIGSEWVPGDPRRDGRIGVTYAVGSNHAAQPTTRDPDGSNAHLVSFAQLDTQIEEALSAWRAQSCSAPIARVAVAAGTDPDQLDEYFRGLPESPNYVQPADIVEAGWQPAQFFRNIAMTPQDPQGLNGNNIIGITFTFNFVDAAGNATDIDHNGKDDTGLAEIFYNNRFAWGNNAAANVVDFYSIITHETGHALGLGHFGKLFVTKHDAANGIQLTDIKYAPYAIMNAAYVTGRNEIAGTDHSSFCQIWSSAK